MPPAWRRLACAVIALAALAGCAPKMGGVRTFPSDTALHPPANAHVEMHYLGNGGWLIRRGDDVVATAPFVSNPALAAIYTPSEPNIARINKAIPEMPDVRIMLLGHSHYDHAMDLPHIMSTQAKGATLYASKTATYLLGETIGPDRVVDVTDKTARGMKPGGWTTEGGVRFMPLASTHAPHVLGLIKVVSRKTLIKPVPAGNLPTVPSAWPEGETLAFLIDFMKDGKVEFRVYYQDAAADPGQGLIPRLNPPDDVPVDVAILCVAGFSQVPGNPEGILGNTRARYVIGGHWEDFIFAPSTGETHRPVPGTDVTEFMERAHAVTDGPVYLPAPGQTMFFPIAPR